MEEVRINIHQSKFLGLVSVFLFVFFILPGSAGGLDSVAVWVQIWVRACGRVVVAHPGSVVFPGFSSFLHHV